MAAALRGARQPRRNRARPGLTRGRRCGGRLVEALAAEAQCFAAGLRKAGATDVAPTINAEVTATTATANATMEMSRLAGLRFGVGGASPDGGCSKKVPRLRGVRAARGGGNGLARKPNSNAGRSTRETASSSSGGAMPGIQRGLPALDLCTAFISKRRSMILRPSDAVGASMRSHSPRTGRPARRPIAHPECRIFTPYGPTVRPACPAGSPAGGRPKGELCYNQPPAQEARLSTANRVGCLPPRAAPWRPTNLR